MNLSITSIFKQLGSFYKKLGKGTKLFVYIALSAIIAGSIIISIILNSGKYTVLYSGLSAAESAQIFALLEEMAVDVKVEDDGTLLVPALDEAKLKMQLASEGYPKSTLNYDIFTEKSDLLTSDYEKKQLLVFQLQDRLQNSIKTLQGVNSAIVNLSIPEDNSYVLKDEKIDITASVILELYSNAELSSKQIKGIEQLVANSVPGLSGEKVAIINSQGEQLNSKQAEEGVDSAYLKIETVNIINDVFENNIEEFLKPIFGENGMSVAVNVKVDFGKVSSEEIIYTPVIGDNGIISWVERSGKATGNNSATDTVSNTDGVPIYTESDDSVTEESKSGIITSDNYSAEYLVNQLVKVIQDNGGNITDVSVALIINSSELSDENKAKYKELVAYSAGVSIDNVVVTNAEFVEVSEISFPEETNSSGILLNLNSKEVILIGGIGAGFILIVVIIIILTLAGKKNKKKSNINDKFEDVISRNSSGQNLPREIVINETREQALKRQIKEYSSNNPETVAQLLRVWIKEDENN